MGRGGAGCKSNGCFSMATAAFATAGSSWSLNTPRKGETFRSLVAAERGQALPPSILVLTTEGQILTRSSAVLHILDRLGGGWRVMAIVGRIVPAGIRDVGYRFIARVRHGLLP